MEAQRLLSGFCSTSPIPNAKTQFFVKYSSPSSSTTSFSQSHKWVSFKARPLSTKLIKCTNTTHTETAEVVVSSDSYSQDSIGGILRKKLAVFVSGGGSNFRSIHEACLNGSILGDVVVLVASKQGCGGADYARDKSLPVIVFPKTKLEPDGISPADLVATLRGLEVDFVLLAGYLKLIPVELIQAYPISILNIHPSLLPAFGGKGNYGMKVHKAVIASGARYSGPTIHFVDEHYDTGRILAQRVVPVLAKDTAEELAARVLREEHALYVEVTKALCEERIIWREDGVPIIRSKENPAEYS
ncbi:phosphoribosylglycinamide formyltransferase, chloroplastic-like [Malus sylvestris]|uniref:phosphoribosylglycinamide formyltransferase, chloroplastic-like n=1 Tax=Malus sylvestris TaxID=3752 RepID=UPI0021AC2465|nr:phosphoribosylglycinamide formyltransferase, chloroplastic-like [Malus sylvestris]XP_050138809.1 phosphoribosylglycinamide formyltransferase, chloroplastic-like [Malus sylvestris]XP_050138810.1 phosphoribosylglycinamide formyltransferase, chloroplastic-like [Malus sylvestris]